MEGQEAAATKRVFGAVRNHWLVNLTSVIS